MRSIFSISLIATAIFAGIYFYQAAWEICQVPLGYRIGTIDDRFAIDAKEARAALSEAERVWEEATGRDLFIYDDDASFTVNFIFDERQALADAETSFKDRLDATENLTDAMRDTYDQLSARYKKLEGEYQSAAAVYESNLSTYNATVSRFNDEGGAPPEEFAKLQSQKQSLDKEQAALQRKVKQLNILVDEINQVGNRSNQLVDTYNRSVETFNHTFGTGREFTQGDYQGKSINIYTFKSDEELKLVLTHEFGHALSLDHVESPQAIMHFLLGEQEGYAITPEDLVEFNNICEGGTINRLRLLWSKAYHQSL